MTVTLTIVDGNVVISAATGRPGLISDEPKLSQDINRLLGIAVQPNGEGAGLDDLVGTVPSSPFSLSSKAQRAVRDAIATFQDLQSQNLFNQRSPAEILANLLRAQMFPAQDVAGNMSSTTFVLRVVAASAAGTLAAGSATLTPPGG